VLSQSSVIFTGENPDLILYDDSGQMTVAASYWHCTFSQFGQGNVLVLWLREGIKTIYTDNPALATMAQMLTSYFEGFQELAVPTFPIYDATFSRTLDGKAFYQVTCLSGGTRTELTWQTFRDVYSVKDRFHFGRNYEISFVVCTCETGRVVIGGEAVVGKVRWFDRDPASSVFLALAESWTLAPTSAALLRE
jgi:hypothetical protein